MDFDGRLDTAGIVALSSTFLQPRHKHDNWRDKGFARYPEISQLPTLMPSELAGKAEKPWDRPSQYGEHLRLKMHNLGVSFWNVTGSFLISHRSSAHRPSFLAVDIGYVCCLWFTVQTWEPRQIVGPAIDIFEKQLHSPSSVNTPRLYSLTYSRLSCLRTLRLILIWAEQHTTTTSKLR